MERTQTACARPASAGGAGRAMAVLGAMVFVVSLGYGAGLPLSQLYLSQYLGDAAPRTLAWHVGMLGGVFTLAMFLFAPWWGSRSDRHGRTRVLAAGFALFLLGTAAGAVTPGLAAAYAARLVAGAGAAAIVPSAQAYIADISSAADRTRRFVLLGSSAFVGFLAGPAFGAWLAGPVMGVRPGEMLGMVNWPALAVAVIGAPLLLAIPRCLQAKRAAGTFADKPRATPQRRHFVRASMLLAALASLAVGAFEVSFSLFGGQKLGLPSAAMAVMFVTCSLAMLAAQSLLLLPRVRSRIDPRWIAAALFASALALGFTAVVPDAASLGLLVAVVGTGIGMIGPVLSYELLERDRSAAGALLGRQAAAGNLGQALGSFGAGSLFALHALAPFWAIAVVLLVGVAVALGWWGPARAGEIRRALDAAQGRAALRSYSGSSFEGDAP